MLALTILANAQAAGRSVAYRLHVQRDCTRCRRNDDTLFVKMVCCLNR